MEPPPPPAAGCSLPLDLMLEIVSRCSTTATFVRCAATCKSLRRGMAELAFRRRLVPHDDRFDPSFLAGHFHFEKKRPNLFDPFFVAPSNSDPPVVSPACIHSFVPGLSRKTSPNYSYKPLASRGGLLVLRRTEHCRYSQPNHELFVYNPTIRFACGRLRDLRRPADSYILFPCNDGCVRSFRLIAVRFMGIDVFTQAFTCSYAALRERPPRIEWRLWGESDVAEIDDGPRVKLARHSLPPVLLRGVAYWLCKNSGEYRVLSLRIDTMEASYVALPPECSSTAVFNRKEILVVPSPSPETRLGLLTLGAEVLTFWALANDGVWARHATVTRAQIAFAAGVSPLPWPFQWMSIPMELECCEERSGTVWVRLPGRFKAVVLSLQTMEAEVRFLDHKDPPIVCPYETMDFAACIAGMKQF